MPSHESPYRKGRLEEQYPYYPSNFQPSVYDNVYDEEAMSSYTEIFDVI